MSEFKGTPVTITDQVVCVDPYPEWEQEFFKCYEKILKEIHEAKEEPK